MSKIRTEVDFIERRLRAMERLCAGVPTEELEVMEPLAMAGVVDFVVDYGHPYLLDSPEKVRWANARLRPAGRFSLARLIPDPWKLGDACWYRPT